MITHGRVADCWADAVVQRLNGAGAIVGVLRYRALEDENEQLRQTLPANATRRSVNGHRHVRVEFWAIVAVVVLPLALIAFAIVAAAEIGPFGSAHP